LGRLSAQMHHTKQAEGWSDLPSWLFSLGGNNPFFKQPQRGMGGPVVMPGLNGGRNQFLPQRGMGRAVVMPGFNGGGQMDPRLPIRPNMPVNPAGDKMNPRLPIRPNMPANPAGDKMDPRFGNAPKGPVPPPFELMPAIRGKGPKGNGIKTMPAPVPTDKPPKTPAIELL